MTSAPFALYAHVPWCRHVCPYCDFNVYARRVPPEADDAAAFARETAAWAARPPWAGRPVGSVFLGGGTPSLWAPATVAAVLDAVDRAFGIPADAEVTLEANPGTIDVERLVGYRAAGITRLSVGVQSFHTRHLRTLGRDHGPDDARAAVHDARRAGIPSVSLDLIFGVPGQTLADWQADLAEAVTLSPDHLSAYALTWEPGTPFERWRARGRVTPIDEDVEAAMADAIAPALGPAGYARYEISSWARPGHASRHNQRYWDGGDYLGIGPGAHSFAASPAPGRRWANLRRPDAWQAAVLEGGTAIASAEALGWEQARLDHVVTGLRRLTGVDEAAFAARFGVALGAAFPQLEALARDGLVERVDGRLRLTAVGLRFADTVGAALA